MRWLSSSKNVKGFAVLEMSGLALVLSVAIVFGLGFADTFGKTIFIRRGLEKAIHQISLQPLKASIDVGGSLNIAVKNTDLEQSIKDSAQRFERELTYNYPGLSDETKYLIEGMYQEVSIDPSTGRFLGLRGSAKIFSRGRFVPRSISLEKASFEKAVEEITSKVRENDVADIAEPTGTLVLGDDESYRYVPVTVLYGFRAFVSLDGSPAAVLNREEESISNVLVVPSRGGVR